MDKREYKDRVYTMLAKLIKAMANPHRLEIIDLLAQAERPVEEIANETGISVANASQHLQVLKQSNLVREKRNGNFILYRLASEAVYRSVRDLREIGTESLAEVDKITSEFRSKKHDRQAVTFKQLPRKLSDIVFLDVRPEHEYNAGHIPHALNIPIDQLSKRIKELKKSKQYIAYCRGAFCVFADDAVQLLTQKGFKASRLEEGYIDWKLKFQKTKVS